MNWLVVVLIVVIVVNLGQGFFDLLFNSGDAIDVLQRCQEQRYVFNGQNPYDVLQASNFFTGYGAPLWSNRDTQVLPNVGVPVGASYPPWSYLIGNILYWPPTQAWARGYFAIVESLALLYIFYYGYSLGRRGHGTTLASLILGLSAISVSSAAATVSLGQFGLIAVAALAATESLTARRRPIAAGLTLALALCKPNIA
ncbi:MAG: hypothetical protein JO353_01385, partial [Phycisphaerae bacterium]|nr:hypothetical protein [Phycisphaerae bacterium]